MNDSRPLAADVAFVLTHLRPMLIAKGLPLDDLGPLAFGLAMDARIQVRLATATPEQHEALEEMRVVQQRTTRACLYALGKLPAERVEVVPRDVQGRDMELAELFPLPTEALLAAAAAYLAEMDAEDGA